MLPIRQDIKIYDQSDRFLGVLPNVQDDISKTREINSTGSQITFNVAQNMDVSHLPVEPIETEDGLPLETETGEIITTEGASPVVGSNSYLIHNGYKVKVIEYNTNNPNGVVKFRGYIDSWSGRIGSSEDLTVVCISDGQDLDQHIVKSLYEEIDISLYTGYETGSYAIYNGGSTITTRRYGMWWVSYPNEGDPFSLGSYPTYDDFIQGELFNYYGRYSMGNRLKVAAQNGSSPTTITMSYVEIDRKGGYMTDADVVVALNDPTKYVKSASLVISSTTLTERDFVFDSPLEWRPGYQYYLVIDATGASGSGGLVSIAAPNPNVFNGQSKEFDGTSWVQYSNYAALYIPRSLYFGNETLVTMTGTIESILKKVIDVYGFDNGLITYSPTSIETTGITVTVDFQVSTILEAIRTLTSLAPANWYWYVDEDNVFYFKAPATTADHTFIKGKHLEEFELTASIGDIVNVVYFTGGKPTDTDPNIFVRISDENSISQYRRGLERVTNLQIKNEADATLIANALIQANNEENFEMEFSVPSSDYNIHSIEVGQTANVAAFGQPEIDNLKLQVMRYTKKSTEIMMYLGTIQKRQVSQIDLVSRQLQQLQTVDNPNEAS